MPAQSLLITAIPHGAPSSGILRVLVHIAPRLRTAGTLADYPLWVDWPATIAGVSWSVRFPDMGLDIPATPVAPLPESARWTAVLPPDTPVQGHAYTGFDHRPLHSYQTSAIVEFLADRWGRVGASSHLEHPAFTDLIGDDDGFGAIGFEARWPQPGPDNPDETGPMRRRRLQQDIGAEIDPTSASPADWATPAVAPLPADPTVRRDEIGKRFLRLARFHHRDRQGVRKNDRLAEQPLQPDVHQVLATIRRHPTLERLLGTVIELELPAPAGASTSTPVQVLATWPAGLEVVAARTMCAFGPGTFRAASSAPGQTDLADGHGWLALGDPTRFTVVTVDPDGGGIKALQFADNLARSRVLVGDTYEPFSAATPESYALPGHASAGISVVRVDRGQQLAAKLAAATQLNGTAFTGDGTPAGEPTLWAEDLVRGYRFDIRAAEDGIWRSLQAQAGSYWFLTPSGPQELPGIAEEAVVATGATTAGGASPPPDLYLQESLMRWGGWSLAARLPGTSLGPADEVGVDPESTEQDPSIRFKSALGVAPGSLPRLRYGETYQVRARVVDLTGSSAALDDGSHPAIAESPPVPYLRYEPVPSPVTVLHAPGAVPGERAEIVVVRTDNALSSPGTDDVVETHRHVLPPRGSVMAAEHHGMFDLTDQPGAPLDPAAFDAYSALDANDLANHPDGLPDPDDPQRSRYFPVDHLPLNYLPDPLARVAVIRGLPEGAGAAGTRAEVPFAVGAWPDWDTFRLRLAGGSTSTWTHVTANQVLDLSLAPAEDLDLRLSSRFDAGQEDLMGVLQWILQWRAANPAHPAVIDLPMSELLADIADGHHWMVTPWRTVRVVHAVRRPLADPIMEEGKFSIGRSHGATDATVLCRPLELHRKSTTKVDLVATWQQRIDTGPGGPEDPTASKDFRALPISVDVDPRSGEGDELLLAEPHEFGDTKYRLVTYTAVATSAFADFFRTSATITVQGSDAALVDARGIAAATVVVTGADGTEYRQGPAGDYTVDEVAGTISRTPQSSVPSGATVDVSYVADGITTASAPRTRAVPSSARPAAPILEYAVPTFAWELGGAGEPRIRRGRGLRLYLRRPWWSSGDDEQLAVVLWSGGSGPAGPPEHLHPYVTQWGFDPISAWSTSSTPDAPMPPHPDPGNFPLATGGVQALSLAELPGEAVAIAPHDVTYDHARGLWACDVELAFGRGEKTYWPFVRLALARYQPNSLPDVELSRVVLTDFLQVAPDRRVVVGTSRTGQKTVTVTGRAYARNMATNGPPAMRVTVESAMPGVDDPDLRWQRLANRQGGDNPVFLTSTVTDGNFVTWSGAVSVPPSNRSLRLVVEELEYHHTTVAEDPGTRTGARRVVFTDTIEL